MAPDVITLNDITNRTKVQEPSSVAVHFTEVQSSISEQISRLFYFIFGHESVGERGSNMRLKKIL
jgi:hypothetical protein